MRFAYAGIDFLSGVFDGFIGAGWTPVKLFSRPCDGVHDFNEFIVTAAAARRLPIQFSPIEDGDLADLAQRGCEALVVAGYPWRVPPLGSHLTYGFNVHPSPLPEGRGPYPLFEAILSGRTEWGVSFHKLAPDFDTGDILVEETFPVTPDETHDTLLTKCQIAAGRLARVVAADLPGVWARATPQTGGSYWRRKGDEDRTLDFAAGVDDCLLRTRAFGTIETIAHIGGTTVYVAEARGWKENHAHQPGTIVHSHRRNLLIAARDGYVLLVRWSPIPLATAGKTGR